MGERAYQKELNNTFFLKKEPVLRKKPFLLRKKPLRKNAIAVLLVKLFFKPLQGLRGCGAEPHIRKGLC